MSPIGDTLRNRIRNFPSLVNCCTIDWFTKWPEEALEAVAEKYLQEVELEPEQRLSVIKFCKSIHTDVRTLSEKFLKEEKRHNYVTPTSYLELILTYMELLRRQRDLIMEQKTGYDKGIEKLLFTADEVSKMQDDLNEK
jgi:dynein heavy chain